jgi:phosphatidylserine/phosphatidylglycerophosphate/cardiolipin synthase-like enzyme
MTNTTAAVSSPSVEDLIARYCARLPPLSQAPGEYAPQQNTIELMRNHRAEVFIDGIAYFNAVDQQITRLVQNKTPNRYFYMTAWWLGLVTRQATLTIPGIATPWTFPLDVKGFALPSGQTLLDRLTEMIIAEVDVRIMAWVSPFFPRYAAVAEKNEHLATLAFQTLLSIQRLRQIFPGQPDRFMLNMLAHSLGSSHAKVIVCGDDSAMRAFTSGLDPVEGRLEVPGVAAEGWRDAGVSIEGGAAGAIYGFFRDLWNEQRARPVETFTIDGNDIPSHSPSWAPIAQRSAVALPPNTGKQYVQVLRTLPQMNFRQAGPLRRGQLLLPDSARPIQIAVGTLVNQINSFNRPKLQIAPQGLFEYKVALRFAILHAERYIYIEDQALWSFEVLDWIRERKLERPELKVILMTSDDSIASANLHEGLLRHLIAGLPTEPNGTAKGVALCGWQGVSVHSKIVLIDDTWCCIGSANDLRRSLYTDIELSVSIFEPPTPDAQLPLTAQEEEQLTNNKRAPSFIQRFRRDLWATYYGLPVNPPPSDTTTRDYRARLLSLRAALGLWNGRWATLGMHYSVVRRSTIHAHDVGPAIAGRPFSQLRYDQEDPDSRQLF